MTSFQDEFSDDDEAAYRDDDNDLDLNFENFHMRHGNREIASSPEESAGINENKKTILKCGDHF